MSKRKPAPRPPPSNRDDWMLQIPLSDLLAIAQQPQELEEIKRENARIREEMNALRDMYHELLAHFSDVKRELKGR